MEKSVFMIGEMLGVLLMILFQPCILRLFNSLCILQNTPSFGRVLKLLFVLFQNGLIVHVDILYVGETTLGGFLTMSVLVIDINGWCHFDILIW